jgi:hypothetical protein
MTLQVIDGPTIAAGESLSEGIDCTAGEIVRITVPQEYTEGGNMTFMVSSDGNLFNDLYDSSGREITLPVNPDTSIFVGDELWVRAIAFIKLRSGTRDHPVPQREACKFAIAVETGAAAGTASAGAGQRR